MPNPRILVTKVNDVVFSLTKMRDDRSIEGSWSNPNVPLLIFADNGLPGGSVSPHGGPIGSGMPVQLLFWGSWWLSPDGSNRSAMIEARTHQLLASGYFSELAQYGINPPHWRGALVVTQPNPPMAFNSQEDTKAVPDLIDDLIDDDVFPDPDDEQIAFIVLMPAGFTQTIDANGAHTSDYNYEFPFDKDYYWVAWVRSFGDVPGPDQDPEDTIRTMSHELVEMFTDPEGDGWYGGGDASVGEIGDAAVSPVKVKQTAWVNGAHVQAYWSNAHSATVIPIDRDYAARIRGVANQEGSHTIAEGTFRPDPQDTRFCELIPACCLPDRDFTFRITGYDEVIRLHVETQRYRQPQSAWSIEGKPVSGSGSINVDVIAQRFSGRKSSYDSISVTIAYKVNNGAIELRQVGEKMNFDLEVSCAVKEAAITGNVKVNVVANAKVRAGFEGAELVLDPEYVNGRKACNKAVSDMFKNVGHGGISRVPKPGEPVIIDPGILNELPAFARQTQYRAARSVILLSRMAAAVMPLEVAQVYAMSLAADVPVLADALQARTTDQPSTLDSPSLNP